MIHTSTAVDNFYVADVKNTPSRSKDVDEETEFVQNLRRLTHSFGVFALALASERGHHGSDAVTSILH